jgi:hypothetical protein
MSANKLLTTLLLTTLLLTICELATAQTVMPQDLDMSAVSETHVAIADLSDPAMAGKTFVAATIMNAPLQKLCSVIMDYPEYPQFMPNTERTRVVFSSDDYTLIEMTLGLPLGKTKKYRLKMESAITRQFCQLSWKLVPWGGLEPSETIADTSGYWRLTPYPENKNKTLVKYYVYADPGPVPYGLGWVVDALSKISLPRTLEALRERVVTR